MRGKSTWNKTMMQGFKIGLQNPSSWRQGGCSHFRFFIVIGEIHFSKDERRSVI